VTGVNQVSESTRVLILFVLCIILLLVLSFFIQSLMMRRAMKAVIKILRFKQSLTPETAQFANDVGIKKRSFINFKGVRDYKPNALQYLMNQEIILVTEDGRIYLSEEKLLQSGLEAQLGVKKMT
jgi:hypothetical protein